jgi:hypothetical protein
MVRSLDLIQAKVERAIHADLQVGDAGIQKLEMQRGNTARRAERNCELMQAREQVSQERLAGLGVEEEFELRSIAYLEPRAVIRKGRPGLRTDNDRSMEEMPDY